MIDDLNITNFTDGLLPLNDTHENLTLSNDTIEHNNDIYSKIHSISNDKHTPDTIPDHIRHALKPYVLHATLALTIAGLVSTLYYHMHYGITLPWEQ